MPHLLQDVTHELAKLRQPACYGASLAARQPEFSAFAVQAAKSLSDVVSHTRSAKKKKKKSDREAQAVADNALTALAQILVTHSDALSVAAGAEEQLWNVWLKGLPCQEDAEEGAKNS